MKSTYITSIAIKARPVLRKNDVIQAGIFVSFARGDGKKKSDIDFLVRFRGRKSLLDLVSLKMDLEKSLKKRVDILTYRSIHPLLRDRILHEEIKIL